MPTKKTVQSITGSPGATAVQRSTVKSSTVGNAIGQLDASGVDGRQLAEVLTAVLENLPAQPVDVEELQARVALAQARDSAATGDVTGSLRLLRSVSAWLTPLLPMLDVAPAAVDLLQRLLE